jgi:DNA ligase (NAD+)
MNIEGLGEVLMRQLVTSSWWRARRHLRARPPTLEGLERMGKKSAAKLMGEIERSKQNEVWRLLNALGIRHVGERGAQVLADHFGSVEAIEQASASRAGAGARDWPGGGASVRSWFDEPRNHGWSPGLRAAGVRTVGERKGPVTGPQPLAGQTFVITGTLEAMSREEAARLVGRSAAR